jgi:hypothetical protein
MNTQYSFYITLIISVIVQAITFIIDTISLFVNVPGPYFLIKQLLIMELAVQAVEGSFYIWLVYNFTKVKDVTPKRYIDWVITTPTMLLTLILYLIYLGKRETNETDSLEFFDLIYKNAINIRNIFSLNWLMLLFGYLGEVNIIDTVTGVAAGFVPFFIYYFIIYINYAVLSQNGWKMFWYFFFFWSLYGVAALFSYNLKNTCYNILDLFAKNFFGLFLGYIVLTGNY